MKLVYVYPKLIYGYHIQKEKLISNSIKDFIKHSEIIKNQNKIQPECFQIYLDNPRSGSKSSVDIEDYLLSRELIINSNIKAFIHACLIYNLCGSVEYHKDPNFEIKLNKTLTNLTRELDLCVLLGFHGVIVHIGSCKDKKSGLKTILLCIKYVLTSSTPESKKYSKILNISEDIFIQKRKLILENAAGEGNKIGSTFDELEFIFNNLNDSENKELFTDRCGVCIDTCHAFASGMCDFGSKNEVEKFFMIFKEKIGLEKLDVFHLNDSRGWFSSKKDRHENISEGYIFSKHRDVTKIKNGNTNGNEGLNTLLENSKYLNIPLIGEPPATNKFGDENIGSHLKLIHICNELT